MRLVVVLSTVLSVSVGGQAIPVAHPLGRATSVSPPIGNVSQVRQLSDGRLLVNDAGARQLLLFDSTLTRRQVVLDTAGPIARRYGVAGSLHPFTGDSTLFSDRSGRTFLVLGPDGAIARAVAFPPGTVLPQAKARLDARGRLIYESAGTGSLTLLTTGVSPARGSAAAADGRRISFSFILAYDLSTHGIDTVARFVFDTILPAGVAAAGASGGGGGRGGVRGGTVAAAPPTPAPVSVASLFPVANDWAVMTDGTIALVRGDDYHIDWIDASGQRVNSRRIPHEWRRLNDADKVRLVDSIRIERDSVNAAEIARHSGPEQPVYDRLGRITSWRIPPARGYVPPPRAVEITAAGMPDFFPAFVTGVMPDADNRLWIPHPPTMARYPNMVYDVIDRSGALVDRVATGSATIVGFGPRGVVYVLAHDAGVARLERRNIR